MYINKSVGGVRTAVSMRSACIRNVRILFSVKITTIYPEEKVVEEDDVVSSSLDRGHLRCSTATNSAVRKAAGCSALQTDQDPLLNDNCWFDSHETSL